MKKFGKLNWFHLFLGLFIIFLNYILALSVVFFSHQIHRQVINEQLDKRIPYRIRYQETDLNLFPYPTLELHNVELSKNENEPPFAFINSIYIEISWSILFTKRLQVKEISANKAEIIIKESPKNIKDKKKASPEVDFKSLSRLFGMERIALYNIHILFQSMEGKIQEDIQLNKLDITIVNPYKMKLESELKLIEGDLGLKGEFDFLPGRFDFDSLGINLVIHSSKINILPLKEYYSYFLESRFDNTSLSGSISFTKEHDKKNYKIITDGIWVSDLRFTGDNYPPIWISGNVDLDLENKKVNFNSLNVNYPNGARAYASGNLSYNYTVRLYLYLNGEFGDIEKITKMVIHFLQFKDTGSKPDFFGTLDISMNRILYKDFIINQASLQIKIQNKEILLQIKEVGIFSGIVKGEGKIITGEKTNYSFELDTVRINLESLIQKFVPDRYITGVMDAKIKFTSSGIEPETFASNFQANLTLNVRDGELFGYANLLKPVFSLGRIINFSGPKGKSAGFQKISAKANIKNRLIKVESLTMTGVGIDAKGKGVIGFDRKIDLKVTVSLGGIAGKAFQVPIIYRGIMPVNLPYPDPIWLGSVYLGSTVLGGVIVPGPVGTVGGGAAGSVIYDYANRAYDSFRSLFRSNKEEK